MKLYSPRDGGGVAENWFGRARSLSSEEWADLLTAARELALARIRIAIQPARTLLRDSGPPVAPIRSGELERQWARRVARAIARMSHRVPWRADCLVQALAAQRWLGRLNIDTDLALGVQDLADAELTAHAWLSHGDIVVTGGDVTNCVRFSKQ